VIALFVTGVGMAIGFVWSTLITM